ncbi:1358_t:CDS:2, partial [Acaulospora morrowiae]
VCERDIRSTELVGDIGVIGGSCRGFSFAIVDIPAVYDLLK